ncbi:hypothetical protein D3C72_1483830 [compost metagenome]
MLRRWVTIWIKIPANTSLVCANCWKTRVLPIPLTSVWFAVWITTTAPCLSGSPPASDRRVLSVQAVVMTVWLNSSAVVPPQRWASRWVLSDLFCWFRQLIRNLKQNLLSIYTWWLQVRIRSLRQCSLPNVCAMRCRALN